MQTVKLKAFGKFESTIEALASATALGDSKLSKGAAFLTVVLVSQRHFRLTLFHNIAIEGCSAFYQSPISALCS